MRDGTKYQSKHSPRVMANSEAMGMPQVKVSSRVDVAYIRRNEGLVKWLGAVGVGGVFG